MEIKDREKSFFMEGTLRICGSLEIEKALGDSFKSLRKYIPLDEIYLSHFRPEMGATKVFAMADKKGGKSLDLTIKWSKAQIEYIENNETLRNTIANKADEHPILGTGLKVLQRSKVSALLIRLVVEDDWMGGATIFAQGWNRFTEEHLNLFALLRQPFTIALSNYRQYNELLKLKDALADDKNYFQKQLQIDAGNEVVGADFGLKRVMGLVQQVAAQDSPVLLRGETGTGKEVIANAIHNLSNRREGPFIKVNCGAIPESLMDSELFGHEKGAFTGALQQYRGRFERAHGGTIFLDEIGELSQEAQVRLLRVLQDKTIERVGGKEILEVDIRVIAATHRDLEDMIKENRFREDLYFRLQVFPIIIPPLRHRRIDILALVQHFITRKSRNLGFQNIPELKPGALEPLSRYPWPGNVRELENMVERAMILNPDGPIQFEQLSANPVFEDAAAKPEAESESLLLDDVVSKHVQSVLKRTGGKINGKNGAAKLLGLNPSTLRHKLRKLNIPFGRNA